MKPEKTCDNRCEHCEAIKEVAESTGYGTVTTVIRDGVAYETTVTKKRRRISARRADETAERDKVGVDK